MKVLLLENVAGVAVDVFREAGYEVESLKAALDERRTGGETSRRFGAGRAFEDAHLSRGARLGQESGRGGRILHWCGQD